VGAPSSEDLAGKGPERSAHSPIQSITERSSNKSFVSLLRSPNLSIRQKEQKKDLPLVIHIPPAHLLRLRLSASKIITSLQSPGLLHRSVA